MGCGSAHGPSTKYGQTEDGYCSAECCSAYLFPVFALLDAHFAEFSGSLGSSTDKDRQEIRLATAQTTITTMAGTNTVLTAWVGDSRCVHCTPVGTESLTVDHKPQDLPEMTRILASGGRIVAGRVVTRGDTTLAMSRSIGDVMFQKVGVSHRPMIKRTRLVDNQDTPLAKQFILCCSDGIWEFISDTEAADIMRSYLPERATEGVEALVGESRKRWLERTPRTDDISCIALMIGCATA